MKEKLSVLIDRLMIWLDSFASAMFFFGLIVIGLSLIGEPNIPVGVAAVVASLVFLVTVGLLDKHDE